MDRQMTLAEMNDEFGAARTNKKEFLEKMDRIIPWAVIIALVQPFYYKGERGNKPYPLELMLRIFILQNLYDLADMKVMNEVLDSRAFAAFCCINSPDEVPDGDTIGRFRNLLTEHDLQKRIFDEIVQLLTDQGLILKKGTIVDSTFIEAPSSTKNQRKERDPEAHSSKKGNTWHFGYKAHIGVDRESGLVHHVKTTAANEHDVTAVSDLRFMETAVMSEPRNVPKQLFVIRKARKSNISFAGNRLQFRSYQKAVSMSPEKLNTRSRLSGARLNTYSQL